MSRSGYIDDMDDQWQHIRWRGAVASALRGRRGQAFLNEMLAAMDAMPEKKLIRDSLEAEGAVCAIGAVGKARGIDMSGVDPEDSDRVSAMFGIPDALAREIVYTNDECFWKQTPEERFTAMRDWIKSEIWHARGCVENRTGGSEHLRRSWFGDRWHWQCVIAWNEACLSGCVPRIPPLVSMQSIRLSPTTFGHITMWLAGSRPKGRA